MSDEDETIDQDENDDDEVEIDGDDATAAIADGEADDDEAVAAAPVGRAARSEIPEAHSVAARAAIRNSLAADVEAFLARGGSIVEVADDQAADPSKKTENNRGRGSN